MPGMSGFSTPEKDRRQLLHTLQHDALGLRAFGWAVSLRFVNLRFLFKFHLQMAATGHSRC